MGGRYLARRSGQAALTILAIIVLNFFFAQLLKEWYLTIYGVRGLFG